MPTIIDELITTVKLDPSDFAKKKREVESGLDSLKKASEATAKGIKDGTADASKTFATIWNEPIAKVEENLRKLTVESHRTGVNMKASGKEAGEFFTNLKTEALGLIGVLVGATGLTSMLRNSAEAARNLGQEARNIGVDPTRLSAMSLALERHGGSAEATRGSLFGISQALERRRLLGDPEIVRYLAQIGATPDQSPDQILEKFVEYAQKNKQNGPQVNLIGRGLGIDQGTINAALAFKNMAEFQKDYNDALRDSPTRQEIDNLDKLNTKFIELEQTIRKFGTDYASDHSKFLGGLIDDTKDFIRDYPKTLEGITDITAAMGLLKAASIGADLLGFKAFGEALAVVNSALTAIVSRLTVLGIPLALSGDTPTDPTLNQPAKPGYFSQGGGFEQAIKGFFVPGRLPADVESEVRSQARANGLDPDHMAQLARVEHGGYDNVSSAGAIGPMQLMPGTAAEMGVDPHDWHQNISGGIRYYKQLLARFGGNYAAADAAYNAGPNNPGVKRFFETGDPSGLPAETRRYVESINGVPARGAPVSPLTGAAPLPLPHPSVMNPLLHPSAYQASPGNTDNSKTVTVGTVNIQTAATDAHGIARNIAQALVVQANSGLA